MKRFISLILTFILIFGALSSLSGCSSKNKLYLFNYGDYIDPEVIDMFQEEYDIEVVADYYAAPEDMYTKFVSGTAKYDLICTSDYMLEKLIKEELLQPINFDNVKNISNISKTQLDASKAFDPELKYTVPHFWGTLGILYNTRNVDKKDVESWDCIFNGKYKDKIIMPNSERDAFFTALAKLGFDPNTTDEKELKAATELLSKQKKNVQAYLLDEAARRAVEDESADMAVIYNGEAYLAFENKEGLDFAIPKEGTVMWVDSFAIPNNAVNKDAAEKFIDFLCREDIAKMNFEYIYYSTPNQAVIDNLDEEILKETAIFPSDKDCKNAKVLKYLGADTEQLYSNLWKDIKS